MSQVEIQVEGHLDPDWADWLEGFTIQHTADQKPSWLGLSPISQPYTA